MLKVYCEHGATGHRKGRAARRGAARYTGKMVGSGLRAFDPDVALLPVLPHRAATVPVARLLHRGEDAADRHTLLVEREPLVGLGASLVWVLLRQDGDGHVVGEVALGAAR